MGKIISCVRVAPNLENKTFFDISKGPFIIYDRGWAGKIQLTTKQNVLPHPLHHKKIQ
jgi:hypothetical protein